MGNAMDGFMKGYGFMDQVYANEAQRERQTKLDAQHDEDRVKQQRLQDMQIESAQLGLEKAKTERKKDIAARAAMKIQNGAEPSDEEAVALRELTGWGDDLSGAEQMEQSVNLLEETYKNSSGMRDFNKPEVLGALSQVMSYDLNTKKDGTPVGGTRQIDRIVPGSQPGSLAFSLSGTYEDETPFQGQPMTVNRGRAEDGDNEVAQVPLSRVMERVQGQKRLLAAYKADPDGFKRALRVADIGRTKPDDLMAVNPWQDVINKRTGEKVYSGDAKTKYSPYTGRSGGGGRGGSGDTAFIKNARFQFEKMPKMEGENEEQRWARALAAAAQKTTTSPVDAKAKIYNEVLKASLPDKIDYMDEGEKADAYAYAESAAARAANYGEQFLYPAPGKGGKTQPPAPGLTPAPKQGAAATPPVDRLKEGVKTKFANGQVWTLQNGQAVQVK